MREWQELHFIAVQFRSDVGFVLQLIFIAVFRFSFIHAYCYGQSL